MKVKYLIGALLLIGLMSMPFGAWATDSAVTQSVTTHGSGEWVLTFTCTAHSANGGYSSTASTHPIDGYVIMAVTDPGTVSPTASYDLTITDEDGEDIMGGALVNRSATATESAQPEIGGTAVISRRVNGLVTLAITGNSVNSAATEVKLYYRSRP